MIYCVHDGRRSLERLAKAGAAAIGGQAVKFQDHDGDWRDAKLIIFYWWPLIRHVQIPVECKVILVCNDHVSRSTGPSVWVHAQKRADLVSVCNAYLIEEMRGRAADVFLQRDGIDPAAWGPLPQSGVRRKPVIGWVGDRRAACKRWNYVRHLARRDDIEVRTAEGEIDPDDMADWYRGLDAILCVSTSEGTGLSILEAGACGVPYISTPVGCVPEVHEATGAGVVIPAMLTAQAMEAGVDEFIANRHEWEGWGKRLAEYVPKRWAQDLTPLRRAVRSIMPAPAAPKRQWKRRIFVVGMTLGIGGSEKMTADIANLMHREGYEVSVLLTVAAGGVYRDELAPEIAVEYAPNVAAMMDFIGGDACGVIVNNSPAARALADAVYAPVVYITHGFINWSLGNLPEPMPENAEVLAISDQVARGLNGVRRDLGPRISVIRNAIDTDRFCPDGDVAHLPWKNHGPVFLYSGRYSAEKQLTKMVDAFAQFHIEDPSARLLFVGGIDPGACPAHRRAWSMNRNKVMKRAETLGVAGAIAETGVVSNPEDYYRAADVMLLTSMFEGLPLCVMEALACGLPVVSTAVGAVPDLVSPERLVPDMSDTWEYVRTMRKAVAWGKPGESLLDSQYSHTRWNTEMTEFIRDRMPRSRPKVVCLYDVEGWAFFEISRWVGAAMTGCEVTLLKYDDIREMDPDTDLVFNPSYIRTDAIRDRAPGAIQVSCLADHYTWKTPWGSGELERAKENSALFICTNEQLAKDASGVLDGVPIAVCWSGVDSETFHPVKRRKPHKNLVVGWAGSTKYHAEVKGVGIIKEACAAVNGVTLRIVDSTERQRTREEMVKFYHGLDVYVCMSSSEGTGMPLLEAAASGVPLISTDVGVATALHASNSNAVHIIERTAEALRKPLIWCQAYRERLMARGKAARETIEQDNWDWKHRAKDYRNVIVELLEGTECE